MFLFPLALALVLGAQGVASFWPANWRWFTRLLLALAAFPVVGGLVAAASGLLTGYWRS